MPGQTIRVPMQAVRLVEPTPPAPTRIRVPMQAVQLVADAPPQPMPAGAVDPSIAPPSTPRTPGAQSPRERVTAGMESFRQNTMNDPLKRVGIGMEKGLDSSVVGLGKLFRPIVNPGESAETFDAARAMTAPDGTAERIGHTIEQVGEFVALPTGKGNMVRRVAQEGVQSGALSAAQGGDPLTGAATGAVAPVLTRGAQAAGPLVERAAGAIRESAEKRVAQALGATKERFKAMAEKLAPQMLDRGVPGAMGASRQGLLEQATEKARAFGSAIDDALQGAKDEVISVAPIVDALEEAKAGFQVTRRMTITEAARQKLMPQAKQAGQGMVDVMVTVDPRPIQQLAQLQQTLGELGGSATVEQIVAIRRVWDDVVSRAGGFQHRSSAAFGVPLAEQTEAWAKREATGAIRRVLAEANPDLAALNKEYAFWRSLKDVLTATEKRTQAQQGGLGRTVLAAGGMAAGAATGDSGMDRMQNALIGAAGGKYLMTVVTSPRWRFVSANVRNQIADALMTGQPGPLMQAISRATAAMSSGGPLQPMASH